jgi:hypothetical protein
LDPNTRREKKIVPLNTRGGGGGFGRPRRGAPAVFAPSGPREPRSPRRELAAALGAREQR